MKKDNRQRLFEVMGRLDKTFKSKLNEDFEENLPTETGMEEPVEQSPEEKLQELTAKVDELYAMLHSEEKLEPEEKTGEEDEVGLENLQEWNFDKKKDENKDEKPKTKTQFNFDKKKGDEESETSDKENEPAKELKEVSKKIPVAAIAKVGK